MAGVFPRNIASNPACFTVLVACNSTVRLLAKLCVAGLTEQKTKKNDGALVKLHTAPTTDALPVWSSMECQN